MHSHSDIHLQLGTVTVFQPVSFHLVAALSECQTVFQFQLFADVVATEIFPAVADAFTIIIHSVEQHDVAMRMLLIEMSGNDELGVFYTHPLHIFKSEFHHFIIGKDSRILWRIGQRDMTNPMLNTLVEMSLTIMRRCIMRLHNQMLFRLRWSG